MKAAVMRVILLLPCHFSMMMAAAAAVMKAALTKVILLLPCHLSMESLPVDCESESIPIHWHLIVYRVSTTIARGSLMPGAIVDSGGVGPERDQHATEFLRSAPCHDDFLFLQMRG